MAVDANAMNTRHMPLLRTYRRSWGLTLRDLATLLGYKSPAHVSRLESGKRSPGTETALACTVLFGAPLHELFPELIDEVDKRIRRRATRFREGLQNTTTPVARRKLALLDRALKGPVLSGNQRVP